MKPATVILIASLCVAVFAATACFAAAKIDDPAIALEQKVDRYSVSGNFQQALDQLAELGGLSFGPDWDELDQVGVTKLTRVAFKTDKSTVEQLLEMTLVRASRGEPLAWYLDGKTVRISTQRRVIGGARPVGQAVGGAAPVRTAKGPARGAEGGLPRRSAGGIRYDDTPLAEVIADLRRRTGLNIDVNWKSLAEVGIDKDTPVSLEAKGITVAKALDMLMRNLSGDRDRFERTYWVVDEGVVTLATGTALNTEMRTKVLDVSDLLMVIPNFEPPSTSLVSGGTSTGTGNDASTTDLFGGDDDSGSGDDDGDTTNMAQERARLREGLMTAIKDSIGEEMWKPDGKGSITILRGQMVITQSLLGFKLLEQSTKVK